MALCSYPSQPILIAGSLSHCQPRAGTHFSQMKPLALYIAGFTQECPLTCEHAVAMANKARETVRVLVHEVDRSRLLQVLSVVPPAPANTRFSTEAGACDVLRIGGPIWEFTALIIFGRKTNLMDCRVAIERGKDGGYGVQVKKFVR